MPKQFNEFEGEVKGLLIDEFQGADEWSFSGNFEASKAHKLSINPSASNSGVTLGLSVALKENVSANFSINRELETEASVEIVRDKHTWTLALENAKELTVSHNWSDETFASNASVKVLDGMPITGGVSCNLAEGVEFGVGYTYDPSRSGLRDYQLRALLYKAPYVKSGSVVALGYGGFDGVSAGIAVPVTNTLKAVASVSSKEALVGARFTAPDGTITVLSTDLCGAGCLKGPKDFALTFIRGFGDWTARASANFDVKNIAAVPKFGISVSN